MFKLDWLIDVDPVGAVTIMDEGKNSRGVNGVGEQWLELLICTMTLLPLD